MKARRAGRKSAHGEWISRRLGKGKDRDQNMATGKAEVGRQIGRSEGRKGMAKGAQEQAIVDGKAGRGG